MINRKFHVNQSWQSASRPHFARAATPVGSFSATDGACEHGARLMPGSDGEFSALKIQP